MPETLCPIHNEAMQYHEKGKYGPFWSHRTDDRNYPSGWCNGKTPGGPYQAPVTRSVPSQMQYTPGTATESKNNQEPDWDKIAVGKVASNIVTALVERGIEMKDIKNQLEEVFDLAQAIVRYKPDVPF